MKKRSWENTLDRLAGVSLRLERLRPHFTAFVASTQALGTSGYSPLKGQLGVELAEDGQSFKVTFLHVTIQARLTVRLPATGTPVGVVTFLLLNSEFPNREPEVIDSLTFGANGVTNVQVEEGADALCIDDCDKVVLQLIEDALAR